MDASPIVVLAFLVSLGNSGYFFYLGRDLQISKRIFASLHGLLAVAILPSVYLVQLNVLMLEPDHHALIIYLLSIISICSIVYSMIVLRGNWRIHLLHVATVIVLQISFALGLLMVLGT